MSDHDNKQCLWKSTSCAEYISSEDKELKAEIPKRILKCKMIAREMNFSSKQEI